MIVVGGLVKFQSYEIEFISEFRVMMLADMIIKRRLFTLCALAS